MRGNILRKMQEIKAMIRRCKREAWMDDRQSDTLDVASVEAVVKEIKSKHGDMFDTVSTHGNEVVMHLDDADAELHVKTSGTYCESYLVVNLRSMHVETKRDVQRFVDDTIRSVEDIVE